MFVSRRPVPAQGPRSPGCCIKELWVFWSSDVAERTYDLHWNNAGTAVDAGPAEPSASGPCSPDEEEEMGEGEREREEPLGRENVDSNRCVFYTN